MSDTENRVYNILCIHRAKALALCHSKGLRDIQTLSSSRVEIMEMQSHSENHTRRFLFTTSILEH